MNTLEKARQLLETITPLYKDCGVACRYACCNADESGENGMRLFPGEEVYYQAATGYRILKYNGFNHLVCTPPCQRHMRPLACRIFPLVILDNNKVTMDIRAWPVCPLMQSGKKGLRPDFIQAVEQVSQLLLADEVQAAFINQLSKEVETFQAFKQTFKTKETKHVD